MNTIRTIRTRLGLTQHALAKQLGVTQGSVSLYEHDQAVVSPQVAGRLITVAKNRGVDVSYDDIYAQDQQEPSHA